MPRNTILHAIAVLFLAVLVGRVAEQLVLADAAMTTAADQAGEADTPPPSFTELDRWEAELQEREMGVVAQMRAAQQALDELARQAAMQKANALTADADRSSARRLATMYGTMDPEKAAATLAALGTDRAAVVLSVMAPDVAGAILSELPTRRAQAISAAML